MLVDRENKIYNGTYFVSNKGLIYKGGETNPDELEKDEFLLREKDYKFYVDEISADRTEVRLATLLAMTILIDNLDVNLSIRPRKIAEAKKACLAYLNTP